MENTGLAKQVKNKKYLPTNEQMKPERWAQIEEIFQAALDRPPAARASFIKKLCAGDAGLLSEVEKLISSHDTGNPFLESPVWTDSLLLQTTLKDEIAASLDAETSAGDTGGSLAGQMVGSYRLLEEIGRDVLAAQKELPGFRQLYDVALSIINQLVLEHPGDESLHADLASSCDRQGNILRDLNDFDGSLAAFNQVQTIFEQLSAAKPEDDALLRAVAAGDGKIGTVYQKSGDGDKALASYQNLLRINQSRLAKNPANAVMLDDVAGSLRNLGDAQTALGDYQAALENYRHQLKLYELMPQADPFNIKSSLELAISYQKLGQLQYKMKSFAER